MLIWLWLQNQYFTSLENALCISNNPPEALGAADPCHCDISRNHINSVLFSSTYSARMGHRGYIHINAPKCSGALCIFPE